MKIDQLGKLKYYSDTIQKNFDFKQLYYNYITLSRRCTSIKKLIKKSIEQFSFNALDLVKICNKYFDFFYPPRKNKANSESRSFLLSLFIIFLCLIFFSDMWLFLPSMFKFGETYSTIRLAVTLQWSCRVCSASTND